MSKENIKALLAGLFTTRKDSAGEDIIIFSSAYMDSNNIGTPLDEGKHAVYEAVSNAMHDSGLSHGFSYEIASRAVSVLKEAEDWTEDGQDDMNEAIDASVPVYTNYLNSIYAYDSWAVDESRQENGITEDSASDAARAWYSQIYAMTGTIQANLEKLIDEE